MPLLTAEELELQYRERMKAQIAEQQRLRFVDADGNPQLKNVWVAYVWTPTRDPDKGMWLLAGFRRRRHRRKPQSMNQLFSKVRRQLGLEKKAPVLLLDLEEATHRAHSDDQTWRTIPPHYQERQPEMPTRTPTGVTVKPKGKTRAKVKAYILGASTRFVVIGRAPGWNREPGYLYLGPLESTVRRLAEFEAKRLFGLYTELLVIAVDELPEPLRNAMMRSKRVRAGVTRIAWPQTPPEFDPVWLKFVEKERKRSPNGWINVDEQQLISIGEDLHDEWEYQGRPWITLKWFHTQTKYWREACDAPKPKRIVKRKAKVVLPSPSKIRKTTPVKRKARSGNYLRVSATLSVRPENSTPTNRGTRLRVEATAKLIAPPERLIEFGRKMFFAVLQPKR